MTWKVIIAPPVRRENQQALQALQQAKLFADCSMLQKVKSFMRPNLRTTPDICAVKTPFVIPFHEALVMGSVSLSPSDPQKML